MPNEIPIKDADVDKEDSDGSTALEVAKQVLGIAKGNAFDAINKYADAADKKKTDAEAKCKSLELKSSVANTKLSVAREACELLCGVIGIVGTNPACIPCRLKLIIAETAYGVAKDAAVVCELAKLTFLENIAVFIKGGLWITHWSIKVA